MGRYYSGDIEGKFWFGTQSSDDADFFGVQGYQPNYLEYNFTKDDLKSIKQGIKICLKELDEYKIKIDKFFKKENSYTDEMLAKSLDVDLTNAKNLLMWYARLLLGEKILKCVEDTGECNFEAEL